MSSSFIPVRSWLWDRLTPQAVEPWTHIRAVLIAATCVTVSGFALAAMLVWLISGDLQGETVVACVIFIALFAGVLALNRRGHVQLAAACLTVLLTTMIFGSTAPYGAGTTANAAYIIVIILAAVTLGPAYGYLLAGLCSALLIGLAWAEYAGYFVGAAGGAASVLTFDAPAFTFILLTCGLLCGLLSHYARSYLRPAPPGR